MITIQMGEPWSVPAGRVFGQVDTDPPGSAAELDRLAVEGDAVATAVACHRVCRGLLVAGKPACVEPVGAVVSGEDVIPAPAPHHFDVLEGVGAELASPGSSLAQVGGDVVAMGTRTAVAERLDVADGVSPGAASHGLVARAAGKDVVVAPSVEEVGALEVTEPIRAGSTDQPVAAAAAAHEVGSGPTAEPSSPSAPCRSSEPPRPIKWSRPTDPETRSLPLPPTTMSSPGPPSSSW